MIHRLFAPFILMMIAVVSLGAQAGKDPHISKQSERNSNNTQHSNLATNAGASNAANRGSNSSEQSSSTSSPPGPASPMSRLSYWSDWSSIAGFGLAVFAVILAILIYHRQGREQTKLAGDQTELFRKLTDQQTDSFTKLTDQQTEQFGKVVERLSYEVHPIEANKALELVADWFRDKDLLSFEFFSTFSVVPLFWDDESRTQKATELLSDRQFRDKVRLVGPSTKRSEQDFSEVARFLVKKGSAQKTRRSRILNWLADAFVDMGELEWEQSSNPTFETLEQMIDKVEKQRATDKLIESLSKTIATEYRRRESEIQNCVYHREQASTLTVNYALAKFKNKSPSESFEMLVFSDSDEDLARSEKGNRPERMLTEPRIYRTRNRLLMRAICDPVNTTLMQVNQLNVEQLTLWNIQQNIDAPAQGIVLILPNAYGIGPYQKQIATGLAENGWDTYWFAFSGQGTLGELSLESAVRELETVMKALTFNKPESLSIIAHGIGAWSILEYLKRNADKAVRPTALIINGMLTNLGRVLESEINQIEKHRVCFILSDEVKSYDPASALRVQDLPILFCHALDDRHLLRTNQQEMEAIVDAAPRAKLCWFDKGYDEDLEALPEFVETYVDWLAMPR